MLIFLDLETTGIELEDKICSIALIAKDDSKEEVFSDFVNEGKKIPSKTSAINHITNEMLKDKPTLKESKTFKFLTEHNDEENTLILHNAKFDIEKLASVGFFWRGDIVDTLRVTKHLIPECELFALQNLRYELQLYKTEKEGIVAHDALSDTYVIQQLFEYLLEMEDIERMKALTQQNVLMSKIEFGKYKGEYIEEIMMKDRGYLEWLLTKVDDLDEDLRYSIGKYLGGEV